MSKQFSLWNRNWILKSFIPVLDTYQLSMFISTIMCEGLSAVAPNILYKIKEHTKILQVSPRDLGNSSITWLFFSTVFFISITNGVVYQWEE